MEEKLDQLSADWDDIQGRKPSKIDLKNNNSDTIIYDNNVQKGFDISDEDLRDCCIVNDNKKYPANRRKRSKKTPFVLLKSWKRTKKRLPRIKNKRSLTTTNDIVEKKNTLKSTKNWVKNNNDDCPDLTPPLKSNTTKKHEKKNRNDVFTTEKNMLNKNHEIIQMKKNDHYLQRFSVGNSETPDQKLDGDNNSNNLEDIMHNVAVRERCSQNEIPGVDDGTLFKVGPGMNREEKVNSTLKRSPKINKKQRKDAMNVEYQNKRRWFLKSLPPDSHHESSICLLSPESNKLKSDVMKDIVSIQENGSLLHKYTNDNNSCVSGLTNMNDMVHSVEDVKHKKIAKSHLGRLKKYDDIVQAYSCEISPSKSTRPMTTIPRSTSHCAVHDRKMCSVRLKSQGINLKQHRKTCPAQLTSPKSRSRVPPVIVVYNHKNKKT